MRKSKHKIISFGDCSMPTVRTDLKPQKAFWLIALLSLIIMPIINYFVLDYLEFYFSGDITKETVSSILSSL